MKIAYIESQNSLTAYIDGKSYVVSKDNPAYSQIFEALLNEDGPTAIALINPGESIRQFAAESGDEIRVENGYVYYKGEEIHGVLVDKILELQRGGYSIKHLVKFLENLMKNPSKRAVDSLYIFLQNKNLPITPNGTILVFKAVTSDYKDKYSGRIDNSIRANPKVERNTVDENWELECSSGLHIGTLGYLDHFARDGDKTLIVEFSPEHVVSIPSEAKAKKIRVCEYKVVSHYDYQKPLDQPIYNSDSSAFEEEPREYTEIVLTDEDKKYAKAHGFLSGLLSAKGKSLRSSARIGTIGKRLHKKVNYDIIINAAEELGLKVTPCGDHKKNWIIR